MKTIDVTPMSPSDWLVAHKLVPWARVPFRTILGWSRSGDTERAVLAVRMAAHSGWQPSTCERVFAAAAPVLPDAVLAFCVTYWRQNSDTAPLLAEWDRRTAVAS